MNRSPSPLIGCSSSRSAWYRLAAAGIVAALSVACVGSSQTRRGGPSAAFAGPTIPFNGEVKPLVTGRGVVEKDGSLKMAWSGTSATLKFHGTAVSADISDSGANQFLVLIDGAPKREKVIPTSGRTTVELIRGLPRGEHTVTLYKLTEPLVGTTTVHGFILDESGKALPLPEEKRPEILIVGDSISTGYGNEGDSEKCPFSPETENHFLSYGARAARELGANLTTVAWSGKGVFSNRGSKTDTTAMPALWKKALPAEGVDADLSQEAPVAIVINLGTNDFAPEVTDRTPFAAAYAALVSDVRKQFPEAHIFLAAGPNLSDEYPQGQKALSTVTTALTELVQKKASEGDSRLHFLSFAPPTPEEGFGCDYHPSTKTHARMAATLVRLLRDKAGM